MNDGSAISPDRAAARPHAAPSRPSGVALSYALAAVLLVGFTAARAAELIVVDQPGCPYCARFEAEIAPAWPNTAEGRRAPLRRLDLHADWPDDLAGVERATLTPTFILVEGGREVDRLAGYPGDDHFWFLVGEMLAKLPSPSAVPSPTER